MQNKFWARVENSDGVWLSALLIGASVLAAWFGWRQIWSVMTDQGWFLQVAHRVAQGQVLYRDVMWVYAPLPVYLMSGLMRLGDDHIAYYSAINLGVALGVTSVLYIIHRFVFSSGRAALLTLIALAGWGNYFMLWHAYTPGVAFGIWGALSVLCGLLAAITRRGSVWTPWLVGGGILLAVLSKQDSALVALGLAIAPLGVLAHIRVVSSEASGARRAILLGITIGLTLALLIYGGLAYVVGPINLWAGLSGYDHLRKPQEMWIGASSVSAFIAPGLVLLLLGGLGLILHGAVEPRYRWHRWLGMLLVMLYVALIVARYSWAFLWRGAAALPGETMWERWLDVLSAQVRLAISISSVGMMGWLFARWSVRWWRRETLSRAQWICFWVLLFTCTIQLRYVLVGSRYQWLVLFPLFATCFAEFPRVSEWVASHRPLVIGLIGLLLMIGLKLPLDQYRINQFVEWETVHGRVTLYQPSRDLMVQVIRYLDANTTPADSIAVLGAYPGIYYFGARANPLRIDYQNEYIGVSPADGRHWLTRLAQARPRVLLIPQADEHMGVLNMRDAPESVWVRMAEQPVFGSGASEFEAYVRAHYRFEQFLGDPAFTEFAVFTSNR